MTTRRPLASADATSGNVASARSKHRALSVYAVSSSAMANSSASTMSPASGGLGHQVPRNGVFVVLRWPMPTTWRARPRACGSGPSWKLMATSKRSRIDWGTMRRLAMLKRQCHRTWGRGPGGEGDGRPLSNRRGGQGLVAVGIVEVSWSSRSTAADATRASSANLQGRTTKEVLPTRTASSRGSSRQAAYEGTVGGAVVSPVALLVAPSGSRPAPHQRRAGATQRAGARARVHTRRSGHTANGGRSCGRPDAMDRADTPTRQG